MADVLIDPTVVENLVGELLLEGPDALGSSIRVLYPHEAAPHPYADQSGDTVYERWCRINNVRMVDSVRRRNTAGDNDQQVFVLAITCGVSAEQMRAEPARLNQVAHLVRAALRGGAREHAATTQSIQIEAADLDTTADAAAPINQTAVVTCRGLAQRVSGSSATLNT